MKNQDKLNEDFPKQVNMYLDNELSQDDQTQFLNTLQENSAYYSVLDNERSFRHFVKNNLRRSHVSPRLIQNIKEQIRIA